MKDEVMRTSAGQVVVGEELGKRTIIVYVNAICPDCWIPIEAYSDYGVCEGCGEAFIVEYRS